MGLENYLMMGFGISALYIGVKYGPQIIKNLQQNQANPPPAQAQTPPDQTQTTTTPTSPSSPVHDDTENIPPVNFAPTGPRHQNDTGTYKPAPPLSLHDQGTNVQPPNQEAIHPSNGPHVAPTPTNKPHQRRPRRHTTLPKHHQGPCPDGSYPDANNNCKPIPTYLQTNIGYWDGYEIPVAGPQWRQSIPYYQAVANQAMVQRGRPTGRVRRALAAGNHDFMPGGFVLSEASVRRGVNNVYSAGT